MVRRGLAALAILFCLLCPPASARAEQDQAPFNQKELQLYFSTFSKMLGCPKNSYAKFTDINIGEMEFLPQDQNGTNWRQLFTATIQTLPDNNALAGSAINGYASNVLSNYARHATIIDSETLRAPDGTPVIYMEYKIRTGLFREHGVGVYGRHTNTLAAFTRYEVRGRELNDEERSVMKQMARTLTTPKR